MTERTPRFPEDEWHRCQPADVGMGAGLLADAQADLVARAGDRPVRAVVVRDGAVVTELNHRIPPDQQRGIASAAKSVFSCMLGIALAEGVIDSADGRVVELYPEMMDVPPEAGPKPGRFAREKDRAITCRQLISNSSGYLKPGEAPGRVFHYQTFGMNILCHALATAYGRYDSRAPERLAGFGSLIEERIRDPIGGTWRWGYNNFELPPAARANIFGNYTALHATCRDLARLGWLWCNFGRWADRQVVPPDWLRESLRVNPAAASADPPVGYGQGFWTNAEGACWPTLPRDSFAAAGAGGHHVWCCPRLGLTVAECPGLYDRQAGQDTRFIAAVLAACRDAG